MTVDIRTTPLNKLLEYNLKDCLGTWFVYEKNYPIMVQDLQEELYLGLMKDSLKNLIHVELTGMPMCMKAILKAEKELTELEEKYSLSLSTSPIIEELEDRLTQEATHKDYESRKAVAKNPDKTKWIEREVVFNAGSGLNKIELLYNTLELPVLDYTKTKLPATGAKEIEKLLNHTNNPEVKAIIQNLIDISKVSKILSSFIPAFKQAQLAEDGIYYLFGSFNLGGTVSGRLSCKQPNLMQIPSGSTFSKLIKQCFISTDTWIFCGADFNALEDKINTLLTRDPNKEKIYLEGYDSHAFRAYSYWPNKMPDIVNTLESINTIPKLYKELRQLSKAPTFALTFAGTYSTLMKNCGFTKDEAMQIEQNYHTMYETSGIWLKAKLKEAASVGYSTGAFGLRIRCPVMHQVLWNDNVPREAAAESRTLGNAISGQSYGMLNNRAAVAFMERVYKSKYRYAIKPVAQIHDSQYYMIKNSLEVIEWVNTNLCECMAWQDLPELIHAGIKLSAELDLCPTWADVVTLPNNTTIPELAKICQDWQQSKRDA